MRIEDLTYKEMLDLMLNISSELSERSQKDFHNKIASTGPVEDVYVKEISAVRDIELAVGAARSVFEETGKIKTEN